ncbi:MAG: hypothetical protein JNL42_17045 [Anaerolineae bacterium]|nr:hypothetical protein [Anaerolineae bacterium]
MDIDCPVSAKDARDILYSFDSTDSLAVGTEIECFTPHSGDPVPYSVKRVWHGRFGIRYGVVEMYGQLQAQGETRSRLSARFKVHIMAFVNIILILAFLAASTQVKKDGWIYAIGGLVVAGMFVLDAYVLFRVVECLKTGISRTSRYPYEQ